LAFDNWGIATAKKLLKPRIKKLNETYFGRQQLSDPKVQERHAQIVQQLRDGAKDEIELLERSERLPWS
jgi:hypothetical protein